MNKKIVISLICITLTWLFFVQPNNIQAAEEEETGTEIIDNITPSSNGSGSNFDTSKYKGYNNRGYDDFEDKFYFTPIKNVTEANGEYPPGTTGSSPVSVYKSLREELAKTGYEAYCLAENVEISPTYNTKRLIDIYLEEYSINGVNLPTISTEKLGTDNAEYPIWRDVDDKRFLMTSLEEYFGFKDLIEKDPSLSEINTAPINSLLSQKQACVQGWESLAAQRRACNRLEESDTCALTKRKIPGSSYENHDLMGMISSFYSDRFGNNGWARIVYDIERKRPGTFNYGTDIKCATACPGSCDGSICNIKKPPSIEGCEALFSEGENLEIELSQEEIDIKEAIINVPTYHDRSYRVGFLVAAIEPRSPDSFEESPDRANLIFNFFTNAETSAGEPGDEVLVAAFKLPDIGTNKGPGSNYGHENWNDPLDLTRMVLTTKDTQLIHDQEKFKKRSFTLGAAESAAIQGPDSRIYCHSGAFQGPGTKTCQYPLPVALTDIINGALTPDSCEQKSETVNFISDLAGLRDPNDTYGKLFTHNNGGQVLLNLFHGSPYNGAGTSPGYSEVDINTLWTINKDTWKPGENGSFVHFYIVYPLGYELDTVEEAIKGTFFTKDQIANLNESPDIVDTFEMTGQVQNLDGGKVGWSFLDWKWKANKEGSCGYYRYDFPFDYLTNYDDPKPCKEKPSIKIEQDAGKTNILGGKLSWWLRKVQVSLSSTTSFAHSYYQSCKTMEDFLLGRCAGNSSGGGNTKTPDDDLNSICEVAEAYNLDCDFFKAVYAVETCSGTDIPRVKDSCCNAQGYCGSMQFAGSMVETVAPGEGLKVCKEEDTGMDNFILAARWMLIKHWCSFNSGTCNSIPNPYDWKNQYINSEGNPNINTKVEVQDYVYGWYGSTTTIETRENWPEGSTYVDAVMALMDIGGVNSGGEWDEWMSYCKYPD
jgi:hypothetical protein